MECHLSKITFMFCHVLWGQAGGHSSLWSVICQESHLCFVMYCGDRRGVTPHYGVSFVKNHIYVLSCIVGIGRGVTPH